MAHLVDDAVRPSGLRSSSTIPVGEEDDAVRVAGGDRVVGDHHDRLAEVVDGLAHELEDLGARLRVEVPGGLVGEDDLGRLTRAPARPRRAAADRRRAPTGGAEPVAQADGVDHAVEPRLVGLAAGERQRQRDVLDRGERRDQVVRLEDEADLVAPDSVSSFSESWPISTSPSKTCTARQAVEPGDAVQQRRLPGAGRAHDRGEVLAASNSTLMPSSACTAASPAP